VAVAWLGSCLERPPLPHLPAAGVLRGGAVRETAGFREGACSWPTGRLHVGIGAAAQALDRDRSRVQAAFALSLPPTEAWGVKRRPFRPERAPSLCSIHLFSE
jgi:hypothetical protein